MSLDKLTEGIFSILTLIVGVAILAIIVSPKAKTSDVIQASASGFVNSLATAESPVTGEHVNIVSSYPGQSMFGGGLGMPSFGGSPYLY